MKFIVKPRGFRTGLCHCDHCDYCSLKCNSRCGIYTWYKINLFKMFFNNSLIGSFHWERGKVMKYIKKPAQKFSQGHCVACSGNCVNNCVGQSVWG